MTGRYQGQNTRIAHVVAPARADATEEEGPTSPGSSSLPGPAAGRGLGVGVVSVLFTLAGMLVGGLAGELQRRFGGGASPSLVISLQIAVPALLGGGVGALAAWLRIQRRLNRALVTSEEFRRRLMAVERNQALWVSLSAVLHDVRNPLHTITLLLETLGNPASDIAAIQSQALEQLALINRRVRRVMDQVSELSGNVERRPIAVRDVVLEVSDMIAPMAAQANIRFRCAPISEQVRVLADRRLLVQAIDHLVLNSLNILKEMPAGTGHLDLEVLQESGEVRLLIQDNGPGLPPPVQERLFEPLLGQSRSGMGLGLAIAHALAQAAGGELELSQTGVAGTEFCLRLEPL
ncbi:MAG TPA: HAMP domain-containing sensor histidine kinase [Acidiferrobacteraceae bacterium]|nr:HAMP domain-containing sensor histidine kinase [Acidiferrobacteraceae bacterium]